MKQDLYLGIDIGTSGVRCCVQTINREIIFQSQESLPKTDAPFANHSEQDPTVWWSAVKKCIAAIPSSIRENIQALAIDGTSGTIVPCDNSGSAIGPALMYNDSRAINEAQLISVIAPADSGAHGASSGLAKTLWLLNQKLVPSKILHQADWIASRFTSKSYLSDENNALKTGYDPRTRSWPSWIQSAELNLPQNIFPTVIPPGNIFGTITTKASIELGLPATLLIRAGTTDSLAAFLASGASKVGDAVTSLGSTLAIKIISSQPIYAPEFGIYSHRLGDYWLAGGASNSGGAALLKYFSLNEMKKLSPLLTPEKSTQLDYYPLPADGERFPVANAQKTSRVTPIPESRLDYFQGMLEGIASIEKEGYKTLSVLGAEEPIRVFTLGGGATNTAWTKIRQKNLGTEMLAPDQHEAACGVARLAMPHSITEK